MKKLLIISYFVIAVGILSIGILGILMNQNDKALIEKQERRYQSHLLADELRQSSDDLTRMARTYVITGDTQYEKMYWDILAIRNGDKPRPVNYDRIYWDLVLDYEDKPYPDGEAISLQILMKQAGFTDAELAELREAQNNSDALVKTETIAMNAVKGLYDDGHGHYIKKGEPDFEMARQIMHDDQYHKHKAAIMKPIDDFLQMINARTKTQVEYHIDKANYLLFISQTLVILLAILAIAIGFFVTTRILKQVGGEPAKIAKITQKIAVGKLDITFEPIKQELTGIYADLIIMIQNLQMIIEDIIQVSQGLANGEQNVAPQAAYPGNFRQIRHALENAAAKLNQATTQNATQDWLKTGHTQFNEHIRGDQDIAKLAKNAIYFLATYIEAQVGLFYLLKDDQPQASVKLLASYAYIATDRPTEFLVGEGLVGEAARIQKTISITQRPEECHSIIRSGLADALPYHIFIIPFFYEDTLKGIIEIGSHEALTDIQREFLEQVMPSIGIAVNMTESRSRLQTLLEQSQLQTEELQRQSEELQTQQEEMQQINETLQTQREELEQKQIELQHHNEELQSQSEELQTQQEELRQANDTLEERTKALEQQKAEIQNKNIALEKTQSEIEKARQVAVLKARELELANRYKSEFLANMSHELRTPLNSLLILAQLLSNNKAGNLTDKQVEYAQTIHSAGSDLLMLINEILDLSKVEAGKIEVHNDKVLLTELVEILEHKFRPLAEEQNLAFHITLADELPAQLHTDEQRLKQILNNLLSNAFKFTSQGEIRFDIAHPKSPLPEHPLWEGGSEEEENAPIGSPSLREGARGRAPIAFSVTDTGIGISEDKQKLIFEAFQQADGSTSRRYGGTGLGLSISRQLARLLGGDILLHSEEDKGSTFTLYLPENHKFEHKNTEPGSPSEVQEVQRSLSSADNVLITTPIATQPVVTEMLTDDRNNLQPSDKTLLIIEDDRKFSKLIMELAREQDFKCLIAEDGISGLQVAEQYKPNAIILDVGLPNIDGWKVMEQLKNNPDTRHIPVHFISAFDQSLAAKKMGAIGYLLKPVNMEQLGDTFQKIEQFITKTVKNVLIVVDNEAHQQQILSLVGGENIQTTLAVTSVTALQYLENTAFDCIILDMDIEQHHGCKLLEQMQEVGGLCQTPVIVYAERELTPAEEALLMRCADELPVKSATSPERLLDEATLFLHQVEANLPKDKRNMLRMVHDKEAILALKKVLIVDDDPRNSFALATILEDKQMEVLAGDNGFEALQVLDEHPDTAIVLMDIMMPEMDGYEAMRKIREQARFRPLPIIALTAKAMKGDKAKCIEAGANDYLSKPVDTDKLISLMRVWLYR
jgi:signal transduction histidine kinase/CheY-like chemotaxis protein